MCTPPGSPAEAFDGTPSAPRGLTVPPARGRPCPLFAGMYFLQSIANEQAGRRPALVLSPRAFNELTGRCIACPITRRDRLIWSFHAPLPARTFTQWTCGVTLAQDSKQAAQRLMGAARSSFYRGKRRLAYLIDVRAMAQVTLFERFKVAANKPD